MNTKRIAFLGVLLLLVSCTSVEPSDMETNREKTFAEMFPGQILNESIILSLSEEPQALAPEYQKYVIFIENQTEQSIEFSKDFQIEILQWVDGHWIQIENEMEYMGDVEGILIEPGGGSRTSFVFNLNNLAAQDSVRVVLQGIISGNAENNQGAFIIYQDIQVTP